jgi:FixJ family two-component response regulator
MARGLSWSTLQFVVDAMPGLSGHEVCTRLRAVRSDIPVLFSRGHPEDFVGQADSGSGPVAFLKSPTPGQNCSRCPTISLRQGAMDARHWTSNPVSARYLDRMPPL